MTGKNSIQRQFCNAFFKQLSFGWLFISFSAVVCNLYIIAIKPRKLAKFYLSGLNCVKFLILEARFRYFNPLANKSIILFEAYLLHILYPFKLQLSSMIKLLEYELDELQSNFSFYFSCFPPTYCIPQLFLKKLSCPCNAQQKNVTP